MSPNTDFLIPDIITKQDLSSAVLDFTTSIGRPCKIGNVIVNFNDGATPPAAVAVTETITITLDSVKGAIYDTILARVSMIAESDYVYTPREELKLQSGDEIKVYCTKTGNVGIANVIIKGSELLK